MTKIFIIGLSVLALLSLWDSHVLTSYVSWMKRGALRAEIAPLIYFLDCSYCQGFWLCVIGAAIVGNLWLIFPSYGLVVIGLGVRNESQSDQ